VSGEPQTADERHPRADTPHDLLRSAVLGAVAGLRSVMPIALLSDSLSRDGPDIADGGWAIDLLTSPQVALVLRLAALGEVVADKLPGTVDRVAPLPLAGRVVLGGTTCALHSLAEGRASDIGALAAPCWASRCARALAARCRCPASSWRWPGTAWPGHSATGPSSAERYPLNWAASVPILAGGSYACAWARRSAGRTC
jgi:uncharacterized membrane protein